MAIEAITVESVPSRSGVRACDAVIIGAGPAGSSTARRLALGGLEVVLVERSGFDAPRIGESLAPAVQPELAALGVWPAFQALSPLPSYGTRSYWGRDVPLDHSHVMSPWTTGWHVDRRAFDRMLATAAAGAGATVLTRTTAVACRRSTSGWTIALRGCGDRSDTSVRTRVVVDATGRAARFATALGAGRAVLDRLVGVASRYERVDGTGEAYVMVEATAGGWWYSAPVPSGDLIVMAMTDGDLCARSHLATATEWSANLRNAPATAARSAAGRVAWGPRVFSAASHRLIRRERRTAWLAVGDAALAVDPISGSGVVRALRTGRAAAEAVIALLRGGDPDAIEHYEDDRDREAAAYVTERATYYGLEQRWPDETFWSRRVNRLTT